MDDIWFIDTTRGVPGRLTSNPEMDVFPVWSPDGTKVLFQRGTPGGDIYVVPSNGSGTEELVLKAPARLYDWSRDGRLLIYGSNGLDILSVAIFGDRKPAPFVKSEFTKLNAQLSPDGRWLLAGDATSGQWLLARAAGQASVAAVRRLGAATRTHGWCC